MKLITLYKLFRFKPTVAWSICGILLGTATAIHEYGLFLNWVYIAIALLPVILMQGFIAHAINDLEDEEVDKKTDMKGTNRFKVLIAGIASRNDLIYIVSAFLGVTTAVVVVLFETFGFPILIFYAVALYAAIGYSLPLLKLGWKPYSEWTVVFPVLVTLVVAVNYVATGTFSWLALTIGILFALFNIIWFLVSRMMDYEPDKAAGKITTFVKLGLLYKVSPYTDSIHPYLAAVMLLLFWFIAYIGIFINSSIGIASTVLWFVVHYYIPRYYELSPIVLSMRRTDLIFVSIINSIVVSLILVFL